MLSGPTQISMAQINTPSTTRDNIRLGEIGVARDGSLYAWTQAGAVNLAAGLANVSPAKVTNDTNRSLDSTSNIAVGSNKVTVSLGGSTTADKYLDGFLVVNDGGGVGQALQISGNSASYTGGAANACDIYLADPIFTALVIATTKVALVPNPWSNVVVHPGSSAALFCAGVNEVAVTSASYFWGKVRGMTSVLSDGVIAKGAGAQLTTNAVAGALITEATTTVVQRVGTAPEATVDTKYYPLFLNIV